MLRRNTIQRQLVFDALQKLDHPDAEKVYETVAEDHPHISKATVYRNLNLLAEEGKIGKLSTPGGADKFDCRTDPHFHLRCRRCGKVLDTRAKEELLPESLLEDEKGFTVEKMNVEFIGLCPECKSKQRNK